MKLNGSTSLVIRVQAYLRRSAASRYESARVPPFTLFFHPSDSLEYFNYAIPDSVDCEGCEPGGLSDALFRLRAAFSERGRKPRFEFVEGAAPWLSRVLVEAKFVEEARQHLMVLTPQGRLLVPDVPGVQIAELGPDASGSAVRHAIEIQHCVFETRDSPQSLQDDAEEGAEQLLDELGVGMAFLAWWDGRPVAASAYTAILHGVTEIVGVATLPDYRGRGVASMLVAQATRHAFERGAELVCLTAADVQAGRVYERGGFRSLATMLSYSCTRDEQHDSIL